jgi:hypothetical protein
MQERRGLGTEWGTSPMRRGKRSPRGGGASPAASMNRAANGAPLVAGRFVALLLTAEGRETVR